MLITQQAIYTEKQAIHTFAEMSSFDECSINSELLNTAIQSDNTT